MLVAATLAVVLAAWTFVFALPREGLWQRTWITATLLILGAVAALGAQERLLTTLGTLDVATVAAGLGAGTAWLVATHVGHSLLCRLFPSFLAQVNDLYRIRDDATPLWSMAGAVTLMAVAEEMVFRGVLQAEIGLVGAVAAYTAVQAVERKWALALAALLGGIVWGLLAWATEGLVAPILAHVIWTGALAFVWPLRGCDAPDPTEERAAEARHASHTSPSPVAPEAR